MLLIICVGSLLGVYGDMFLRDIYYTQNCSGFLKQTADANTIDLAKEKLSFAINYAKNRGLTSGYTSIFIKTPDEDVGFWFKNLTASLDELNNISPDATQLEKTNVLMKLRETLLDNGEKGTVITQPQGISKHPLNRFFFWIQILLWGLCGFGCIFLWYAIDIH